MLANDVTSVRQRYGRRVWRGIHSSCPPCWPDVRRVRALQTVNPPDFPRILDNVTQWRCVDHPNMLGPSWRFFVSVERQR